MPFSLEWCICKNTYRGMGRRWCKKRMHHGNNDDKKLL